MKYTIFFCVVSLFRALDLIINYIADTRRLICNIFTCTCKVITSRFDLRILENDYDSKVLLVNPRRTKLLAQKRHNSSR